MKSEMNFVSVLCVICIVEGLALEPPHIETYPKDEIIVHGGKAFFVCTANGDPNPQIEWLKNGRRVKSHRYTIQKMLDGSVLRIQPVRNSSDDATFECRAENGIGDPAKAFFDITVLADDELPSGFPKFTRQPNLQYIEKGRNILIPCEVEGDPEPTIRWMKNMIPLDMRTPRYSLVEGYSLQIIEAEEDDQGLYECIAENSFGSATSLRNARIYVKARRVPPSFAIRPEHVYEVSPGSDLNITCIAIGSPMPYVEWQKGSTNITERNIAKNVLSLENIRESSNYTCMATSPLGDIEVTSRVAVKSNFLN